MSSKKDAVQEITLVEYMVAESVSARLRGEELMIKAASFNYAGHIEKVIEGKCIVLSGAKYVFDTGEFGKPWKDAEPVPSGRWNIMIDAIESFGVMR